MFFVIGNFFSCVFARFNDIHDSKEIDDNNDKNSSDDSTTAANNKPIKERKSCLINARPSIIVKLQRKPNIKENNDNNKVEEIDMENDVEEKKKIEEKEKLIEFRNKMKQEGLLTHAAISEFLCKEKIKNELLLSQHQRDEEEKNDNKRMNVSRLIETLMQSKQLEKNTSSANDGFKTHETFLSRAMKQIC